MWSSGSSRINREWEDAKSDQKTGWGGRAGERGMLESLLGDDEPLEAWLAGKYTPDADGRRSEEFDGVAVATDRRVLFLKRLTTGRSNTVVLSYNSIEGVHQDKRSGFSQKTLLTIAGNGRTSVEIEVPGSPRAIQDFVDTVNHYVYEYGSGGSAGGTVINEASPMEELKRAAELHASGALTDAEFRRIKAELLSRI